MKYQKTMKKVMEQLTEYKATVDGVAERYLYDKGKFEEELRQMQGKYTPEYIEESRRNWKPREEYGEIVRMAREKCQGNANALIDQIQKEMDAYFQIPVNPAFASTVTALKTVGAKINNREFQLLQGASGGYWDRKLLSELATSRTKKTEKVKLNSENEPERVSVDDSIPYFGVELPDIEKAYDRLQDVRNSVSIAFKGYCGANYELKDIVFPESEAVEQTNAKLSETYGVEPQEQTLDVVTISRMASSVKCFDADYQTYTAFSEMMGGLMATMPKPERKTALTDSDRKLIDTLISPDYPSLANGEAVKIAKADSRLAEILSLDERYGKAVREALGEVSDHE